MFFCKLLNSDSFLCFLWWINAQLLSDKGLKRVLLLISSVHIETHLKLFLHKHLCPFSKSKFNLKSDRVNLVAPASPIECLLYIPNVWAIQYKLGRKGWPGSEIQMTYGCPWHKNSLRPIFFELSPKKNVRKGPRDPPPPAGMWG